MTRLTAISSEGIVKLSYLIRYLYMVVDEKSVVVQPHDELKQASMPVIALPQFSRSARLKR